MTSAMANEELLKEKERKILALQKTINAFKEYDEKRTRYLQKIQDELEEYSERYLMLLSSLSETEKEMLSSYERKVFSLKTQVKALENKVTKYKKIVSQNIPDENLEKLERVIDGYDVVILREENERYKEKLKRDKRDFSLLITKLMSLERRLGKIKEVAETC